MQLSATIATAGALFAGTNVDDVIVLAVLFAASHGGGRPTKWQIAIGQYAGMAILVAVSILAAWGLAVLPEERIWLLGFVPLALGLYKLFAAFRKRGGDEPPRAADGALAVAALTVANGGDNVAAYTPYFRTADAAELAVTLMVFAVGVATWCLAGALAVTWRPLTRAVDRWGHWLVPLVFVAIGIYVFCKAGAFD